LLALEMFRGARFEADASSHVDDSSGERLPVEPKL
jgi:hypothetical protein